MGIVHVQMPTVNPDPVAVGRPRQCPKCGSEILHRWGQVSKPLRDTEFEVVGVYRYRCAQAECGHTFRHYPQGVDRADQSKRLRCLAALAWSMGLSLRGVGTIFSAFGQGLGIGRMSVWRAVQEMAGQLRTKAKATQCKHQVRVLGVDGAWIRLNGKTTGVMVVVDMGDGQMVGMEVLDEHDPQAVCDWLRPLVEELGVEVIVTDDLVTYNSVEEQLKVERQVCYFHMRRWVGKALDDLGKQIKESYPGWEWVVEEVRLLVEDLPANGDEQLFELWQEVQKEAGSRPQKEEATALQRLAGLIVKLMENWRRYRLHLTERGVELGVPATNNLTEQMIGNGKIRSRTVRGYKSRAGVLGAFMVCAARIA